MVSTGHCHPHVVATVQKQAAEAYVLLRDKCEQRINAKVDALDGGGGDAAADSTLTVSPEQFLALVDAAWRDHCEQLNTVRNIFLYLDRSYALGNNSGGGGVKPIWDMGHDLFRRRLDLRQGVRARLVAALLGSVEKYRNKQACDRDVLGR